MMNFKSILNVNSTFSLTYGKLLWKTTEIPTLSTLTMNYYYKNMKSITYYDWAIKLNIILIWFL